MTFSDYATVTFRVKKSSFSPLEANTTLFYFYYSAYECKPAIIKFTATKLNIIIAKPITANQADFFPSHPFDRRRCKKAA